MLFFKLWHKTLEISIIFFTRNDETLSVKLQDVTQAGGAELVVADVHVPQLELQTQSRTVCR